MYTTIDAGARRSLAAGESVWETFCASPAAPSDPAKPSASLVSAFPPIYSLVGHRLVGAVAIQFLGRELVVLIRPIYSTYIFDLYIRPIYPMYFD